MMLAYWFITARVENHVRHAVPFSSKTQNVKRNRI
jgi:hypothetical protein